MASEAWGAICDPNTGAIDTKATSKANERFSKAKLASYIETQVAAIEKMYRLEPYNKNGTAQLKANDVNRAVAYGKREALYDIFQEFSL